MRAFKIKDSSRYTSALLRFDKNHLTALSVPPWRLCDHETKVRIIINYITQLRHTPDSTRGAIKTFIRAIAWYHNTSLTSGPDPTTDPIISNYRQAIEGSFPDTDTKRRLPLTKDQIRLIATTAYRWSTSGRPEYYRLFILIILSYKAATRISELLKLTRRDVVLTGGYIRFNFITRKNKKRRDPSISYVAGDTTSPFCPVKIMANYFTLLNLNSSDPSSDYRIIFPGGFVNSITGAPTGHISYTQVYNQLICLLQSLNINPALFGWHSPRSSAVVDMMEGGLTDEQIARHTGHRAISSLHTYAQGTIPSRLKASISLSLAPSKH